MSEMVFSTFNGMFGENVMAERYSNGLKRVLMARLYKLPTSLNPASCTVYTKGEMHRNRDFRNKRVTKKNKALESIK
jgi:hypothetical protein